MKLFDCRTRGSRVALVVFLSIFPIAATSGASAAGETPSAEEAGLLHDWAKWDWRLERTQLVNAYLFKIRQPVNAFEQYLRAVTYAANLDSLGLDEFRALSPSRQKARRRQAGEMREKAFRLQTLVRDIWFANQEQMAITTRSAHLAPPGAAESVTRALRYLVNANGIDPSLPSSWYDEAYFCGIVGDVMRQRRALDAALAAIAVRDDADDEAFKDLRLRIALDYAWLLRELGFPEESGARLDAADEFILPGRLRGREARDESRVLRGLLMAETGLHDRVPKQRSKLRKVKVYRRNEIVWEMPDPSNSQMVSFSLTMDRRSWDTHESKFASRWIKGIDQLEQGSAELGALVFRNENINDELPIQLNWRFWQDVGFVHELDGDLVAAGDHYSYGIAFRPYFIYYPLQCYRGPTRIRDLGFGGGLFFRSYDHFFAGGSLFGYAAWTATAVEIEPDPRRRRLLAEQARLTLDTCLRRGIHVPEARTLRGFLEVFLDNRPAALADLLRSHAELEKGGRGNGKVALVAALLIVDSEGIAASLPLLRDAARLGPGELDTWRLLGVAELVGGDSAAGRAAFDEAVSLDPEDAISLYNRALLNWNEGHDDAARADLERAAAVRPDDEQIVQLQATIARGPEASSAEHLLMSTSHDGRLTQDEADRVAQVRGGSTLAAAAAPDGEQAGLQRHRRGVPEEFVETELAQLTAAVEADSSIVSLRRLAAAHLAAGRPRHARDLLLKWWHPEMPAEDICLLLEADRALGDATRAREMLTAFAAGGSPVADTRAWTLVTTICLDHGLTVEARQALAIALELDPGNRTLQVQQRRLTEAE